MPTLMLSDILEVVSVDSIHTVHKYAMLAVYTYGKQYVHSGTCGHDSQATKMS
jgi:hypothetical protein